MLFCSNAFFPSLILPFAAFAHELHKKLKRKSRKKRVQNIFYTPIEWYGTTTIQTLWLIFFFFLFSVNSLSLFLFWAAMKLCNDNQTHACTKLLSPLKQWKKKNSQFFIFCSLFFSRLSKTVNRSWKKLNYGSMTTHSHTYACSTKHWQQY